MKQDLEDLMIQNQCKHQKDYKT